MICVDGPLGFPPRALAVGAEPKTDGGLWAQTSLNANRPTLAVQPVVVQWSDLRGDQGTRAERSRRTRALSS